MSWLSFCHFASPQLHCGWVLWHRIHSNNSEEAKSGSNLASWALFQPCCTNLILPVTCETEPFHVNLLHVFFFFFHGVEHHCKYCAWSTQNSRRNRHLYFRIAYRLGEYLLVKSFPQYFVKLSNEKNLQCHSISFSALILLTLFLRKCYQSNAYQHTSFWLW